MLPVTINSQDVTPLEYKGQRVVTFAMIDQLHRRPEGTGSRNFRENRERFIENIDFLVFDKIIKNPDGGRPIKEYYSILYSHQEIQHERTP